MTMDDKKKKIFMCFGLILLIGVGVGIFGLFYFSMNEAFDYVQEDNGLAMIYHPGRYNQDVDWYNDLYDRYNGTIIGLEVYNQGDRYENDRLLWDAINKERSPNDLVWGFSNDDYHRTEHAFRNYQHMLMPELTEEALRTAMITGAFYFSFEPQGADDSLGTYGDALTPNIIGVSIDGTTIEIVGEEYDSVVWYNDNTEIIANTTSIDVTEHESVFVRATFINEFGRTYSQPFGFTDDTIYNPYEDVNWDTTNHYKANFHTHTTESDGRETPAEVITRYHEGNYDILALTDHNRNTWSWTNWIDEVPVEASKTSEYFPELEMLAVSGNEPSDAHHFGSFFTDYDGRATDWMFSLQRGL